MSRSRLSLSLLTLLSLSPALALAAEAQPFEELLQQSLANKKGVYLHVAGEKIGGRVIGFPSGQVVELTSQEFSHIQVRRDRIDAVSVN
jgi:hypothetical protein